MQKLKHQKLEKILSVHFLKFSLVPIFVIEIALIVLYFSINSYITSKNTQLLLNEAKLSSRGILENEAKFISDKLNEISRTNTLLQNEHEKLFEKPSSFSLPNGNPQFNVASNGVFYKENKIGSSLYYSSKTKITEKEKQKATFTEAMDTSLKSVVDVNPNIVASYFNSWDDMNRLYPFIDKVYEQYGEHIHMEDYNFYYLADKIHNPSKKPTWTSAYLDPAGNGWMLSSLVPIYNNGFLEGVTGLDITIDVFVKNILDRKLPYDANLFMVDKDGMIIAMSEEIETLLGLKELKEHLYTDAILKTIEKPEEFNITTNKSPSAVHFKNILEKNLKESSFSLGKKNFLVYEQDIIEADWKLMILIDKKNIFNSIEELQNLSNKIGYAAIVFLFIFYVIFFYLLLKKIKEFSKTITNPIAELSKQTSKIMEYNDSVLVLDTNILEIDKLSNNFVNMINELNVRTNKLYEAKQIAEKSNKAKDHFLANMSHEFKTPLNSINVISSIMKNNSKGNLSEKEVKNLQIINSCGKELLLLINDLLDLSTLDEGKVIVNLENVDLKDFVNDIYNNYSFKIEEKSLTFTLHIDDSITHIYTDRYKLMQIIEKLLNNAIKFTNQGNIALIVKEENENIRILIKDDGIGITKEQLPIIFDRFKQVDSSTTRKYGGSGLGLAIAKKLVLMIKGDIFVSSKINKGTTFEIVIPKNFQELDNNEIIEVSKDLEKINTLHKIADAKVFEEKEKIVIFNDNPITFIVMIVELRKRYEVIQVSNIDEFLEINNNQDIKRAVFDITTQEDESISKVLKSNKNNFVVIYNDNLDKQLEKKSIFTIKKNEIKDNISKL